MRKEKAPVSKLSRSKALKTQQIFHYRHARKTSILVLLYVDSANSDFFARVFVPVETIIPCSSQIKFCIKKATFLLF